MEHKLNKVDVEIIRKIIEVTSGGVTHKLEKIDDMDNTLLNYDDKETEDENNQQKAKKKKIIVNACKTFGKEYEVIAKKTGKVDGTYIDTRR